MERMQSVTGILVLAIIAMAFSERRSAINWRTVSIGIILQLLLALVLLKAPASQWIFIFLNKGVSAIEEATRAGTTHI